MRRVYFAHPVSDFGTSRQAAAIEAITAFYAAIGQRIQIINPDLPEHQEGYAKKGMPYFRDLVDTCNDLVFMRFPDGSIGAGVAQEIRWASACSHIREVHNGKLYDLNGQPGPVLSIDDTRAVLKSLAPAPQPKAVGTPVDSSPVDNGESGD